MQDSLGDELRVVSRLYRTRVELSQSQALSNCITLISIAYCLGGLFLFDEISPQHKSIPLVITFTSLFVLGYRRSNKAMIVGFEARTALYNLSKESQPKKIEDQLEEVYQLILQALDAVPKSGNQADIQMWCDVIEEVAIHSIHKQPDELYSLKSLARNCGIIQAELNSPSAQSSKIRDLRASTQHFLAIVRKHFCHIQPVQDILDIYDSL